MMESEKIEARLFEFLESQGIQTKTFRHPPVFTVEEAQKVRTNMPGGHCKSLFVRDKKKNYALVMVSEDRRVDLKALSAKIGLGRLSFASAERLNEMLGVIPGSVTPFALFNAKIKQDEKPKLHVALDKKMLAKSPLYYHPLHNAASTAIEPDALLLFIKACGYSYQIIDLDTD